LLQVISYENRLLSGSKTVVLRPFSTSFALAKRRRFRYNKASAGAKRLLAIQERV